MSKWLFVNNSPSFQFSQGYTFFIVVNVCTMCNLVHSIWSCTAHFANFLIDWCVRGFSVGMQRNADSLHDFTECNLLHLCLVYHRKALKEIEKWQTLGLSDAT